uniref:Tyrosinase copper-binding domain-containing protein n=1 Tax=Romanomermis culicivorax TaxID=13658 RepID=A0A915K1H9_ROMCU
MMIFIFFIALSFRFAFMIGTNDQYNKKSSTCLSKQLSSENSFPLKKIEKFCSKCDEWERQFVEGGPGSSKTPVLPLEAQKWVKPLWICRNLDCVCQFRESACSDILKKNRSGEIADYNENHINHSYRKKRSPSLSMINTPLIFKKVKRKEIRSLTDEERRKLFDALNELKNTKIDRGLSRFDTLITYHIPERAVTAHFCPSFFPFHREFLKVTEFALREIDPDISIPYWDLTMDSMLPDPRDSILWTKEFMGTGEGQVIDGPFANWKPWPDPAAPKHLQVGHLTRNVGKESMGEIVKPVQIKRIMNMKTFEELTFCHSNRIWEQWRHLRQTREKRESDYADGSCMQHCSSNMYEPLMPFPTTEHEALSNWYTDNLYEYEPSPTCNANKLDCGSKYLFCDQRRYVCLPKVKIGGNCTGFERYQMTDICYKSVCSLDGVCVEKMIEKKKATKSFVFPKTIKNITQTADIESKTTVQVSDTTLKSSNSMLTTERNADNTSRSTEKLSSPTATAAISTAAASTAIVTTTSTAKSKEKSSIFSLEVFTLDSPDQQKLAAFDDVSVFLKIFMERFIMVFKGWKINDRKNDQLGRFFVEFTNPATMGLLPADISLTALQKRDKTSLCTGFCRIGPQSESYGLCSNMSAKREEDVGIKIDYHDIEKGVFSTTSDSFAFLCKFIAAVDC